MAVLLDLTMPNMDGQQFFDYIRTLNAAVPVILSSGYSEEEAMKRFPASGITGFIQKPYQVEMLIAKIQEIREKLATTSKSSS
jgi:CheY-like chemotaxis protein